VGHRLWASHPLQCRFMAAALLIAPFYGGGSRKQKDELDTGVRSQPCKESVQLHCTSKLLMLVVASTADNASQQA
jgi:hypothetical protein